MANLIAVTVLQRNQYATETLGGVVCAIPSTGLVVVPYTGSNPVNGATANSVVTVPPTGLNQRSTQLIVTSTVAQVITAANAALA
jgi:hypothetical protein